MMVVTILEGRVAQDRWADLETAFQNATQALDAGLVETMLMQQRSDPAVWRIFTVWSSAEALEAMRQSGETPRGVQMFRAVNVEPVLSVHRVAVQARA